MRLILFIITLFLTISCSNKFSVNKITLNTIETVMPVSYNYAPKKETPYFVTNKHWVTKHADYVNYLCEIIFKEEYAVYHYHGQCHYSYFTNKTGNENTLELYWSYKTDCLLNMDFLEKPNGIKKYPKRGDSFAQYTLVNDSTIRVNYYFPEWIKKINMITKDSIFPAYFYLDKSS